MKSPLYLKHADVEALRSCISILETMLARYADPAPLAGIDPARIRLHDIISKIAVYYQIDTEELFTKKRTKPLALIRKWTVGLALEHKVCDIQTVADYLGRTRSDMAHVVKKWRLEISSDQNMRQAYNYLRKATYERKKQRSV